MPRLIWPLRALLDLQRLRRFLSGKNPDAAKRAIAAIRHGMKPVVLQPEIGRPVPGMAPEYREWLIDFGDSGYVVRDRYDGQTALVVAVRHQKEAGF